MQAESVVPDNVVTSALERLDRELVGLGPVKTRVHEIASLLVVDNMRRAEGLSSEAPSLHMSFTGNPGTGKTTVALRMAELLRELGYSRKGHVVVASRDDLVGQFIGHTAPKTKDVIKRAMGGVLFVDEAYYLHRPENERDYGQEAIEILLSAMEASRDDLIVIFAGYKDRMERFFLSNPGLKSRVAHHIDFPDYTAVELMEIADRMVDALGYRLSDDARQAFDDYIALRMRQPIFANARSVRNAIDRMRLRHASRLVEAGGTPTKDQLMTIEADDIRKSRVFGDALGA